MSMDLVTERKRWDVFVRRTCEARARTHTHKKKHCRQCESQCNDVLKKDLHPFTLLFIYILFIRYSIDVRSVFSVC